MARNHKKSNFVYTNVYKLTVFIYNCIYFSPIFLATFGRRKWPKAHFFWPRVYNCIHPKFFWSKIFGQSPLLKIQKWPEISRIFNVNYFILRYCTSYKTGLWPYLGWDFSEMTIFKSLNFEPSILCS